MTLNDSLPFTFPDGILPEGVSPGTNIMVTGPSAKGARDVALRLVLAETDGEEGVLLLSADVSGRLLLKRATLEDDALDLSRVAIVDCSGLDDDEHHRFGTQRTPIVDPGDLTAIQMELSALYETLVELGYDRVRLGVFSVSALIAHSDLETVSRFTHMLTGRVIATGDLGVFVVDRSMHDDVTVDTIEKYCDGTIDIRTAENGEFELRARGFDADSGSWQRISLPEQDRERQQS